MKQKDAALRQMRQGGEGFESYYAALFQARWPVLRESLRQDPLYIQIDFSRADEACQPYFIDAASVCAALCLPVRRYGNAGRDDCPGETVLDMCAAPGGKSLVLAGGLAEGSRLYCNELSPDRKARLDSVLAASLPAALRRQLVTSCRDGASWCRRETDAFSAILLDAPCSSERHVLGDHKYLAQWSASRIKSLAARQWALLSSAFRLLQEGGFLLYATCALAPDENDGVLSRLFKKFPDARRIERTAMAECFEARLGSFSGMLTAGNAGSADAAGLLRTTFSQAEETEWGLQILPDRSRGAGPLFFALVRKGSA